MTDALLPHGENLRRAIQWISDRGIHDRDAIEKASVQFDLTPQEEEFLVRHFQVSSDEKPDG